MSQDLLDATVNTDQTKRSTTAQRITATAAVITALVAVVVGGVVWKGVEAYENVAHTQGPQALRQGVCLTYSNFVLNQHHAGLTVPQIEGVLQQAVGDAAT